MNMRWVRRGISVVIAMGVVGSVLLSGCAKRPYYSGVYFSSPPLVETDRSEMVRYLDWVLENHKFRKLTIVTPEKGVQSLLPRDETSPGTTDWIPLPVLFAARFVLQSRYRGLEVDLLAKTEADGYTPVSAIHDVDGSVRIEMGPSFRELVPPSADQLSREEIQRRYELGAIEDRDRRWQPLELHALAQALALLHPEERAVLRGVRFIRQSRAQKATKGVPVDEIRAQYHGQVTGASAAKDAREIFLYDPHAGHDDALFVGEPQHPYPIPSMAILHEIGHAIADYVRIDAYVQSNTLITSYNAQVNAWNHSRNDTSMADADRVSLAQRMEQMKRDSDQAEARLDAVRKQYQQNDGPVVVAFSIVRGPDRGPTEYGGTNLDESFAECFALAKADPQALKRIYPALPDWFSAHEHLNAVRPLLRMSVPTERDSQTPPQSPPVVQQQAQ